MTSGEVSTDTTDTPATGENTTDATSINATSTDTTPTTDATASTDATDATDATDTMTTTDGASDLKISVDLTSASILCRNRAEDAIVADWIVTLDNSGGLAPATVTQESAYIVYSWSFEQVVASYVTVMPDEAVLVEAGQSVDILVSKVDSLDIIGGDPCKFCESVPLMSAHLTLTFNIDGASVEADDFILSPPCM